MTIAAELVPLWALWLLWPLLLAGCAVAAWTAPWRALWAVPARLHLILGGVLCCVLLWSLSLRFIDGLWLHFLGLSSLTLVLGWRFAILAASLALVLYTLLQQQPLLALPAAWLVTVAVPATGTRLLLFYLRRLPLPNLFVYTLGAGFGGGILATVLAAITALLMFAAFGLDDWLHSALANWPMIFLLGFPEGFINGTVVTTLTVFFPDAMKTFDSQYYLGDE